MAAGAIVLWLVRAGDSIWQRENRLQGRADLPLSPEGRAAIGGEIALHRFALHETAADPPLDRAAFVHHPPDEGATETAAMVGRSLGARSKASVELSEPDLGLLDGLTLELFEERFPTRFRQWEDEPLSLIPPEGEPIAAARDRVLREVARLVRRPRGRSLGLVLHPVALGFVRCALAGRPPEELWRSLEGRPRIERFVLPLDASERMGG